MITSFFASGALIGALMLTGDNIGEFLGNKINPADREEKNNDK